MSKQPQVTFESGVDTVTGSNFLLESSTGAKIMVDCGMIQGEKFAMSENRAPFNYTPSAIDVLIITHAHLDHVGRIPKLVKEGFTGVIYSTPETKALAELVLNDAVSILATEALQHSVSPLYERHDVDMVFPLWKTVPYHESFSPSEGVDVLFKDAGHILGSAMIEFSVKNNSSSTGDSITKILFTGDVGNSPAPLLRDTESIGDVDYLVMESVYGDRNHEERSERLAKFESIIHKTLDRGGTLVIPAFSIDRTQVLLFELNNMVEQKRIPSVPIFVDSPMAIKSTQIYKESTSLFNDLIKAQISNGDDIFSFPHLHYSTSENDSRSIEAMHGAKIVLAGSGMSVGGRIIRHEEIYLPDPKNTILLVGYQTAGSLGRQLNDTIGSNSKKVNIHGREMEVKAEVQSIYGYSAHKDMDHLVEFVTTASDRLKKIFVIMGEPKSSMHLAQKINDELVVKATVPKKGTVYTL